MTNLPNKQQAEPSQYREDGTLDFHSMFYTLQGEGPFAGRRALFIRLAGCNIMCPGCDTEYTNGRQLLAPTAIIHKASQMLNEHGHDGRGVLVVITGGEPLRQNIAPLIRGLLFIGFHVQVETNGIYGPLGALKEMHNSHDRLWFVVSPKTHRIHRDWEEYADAYKYVLSANEVDPVDGLPNTALSYRASQFEAATSRTVPNVARPQNPSTPVYVTPRDYGGGPAWEDIEAVAKSAMKFGYIAGLQLHKIFNLE